MVSKCSSTQWISTDLMGKTVISRRCPFKVHQALWNPSINLLALASQKGEICVRRSHGKHGWKRDVYDVKPLLLERVKSQSEICFETMCWSPNGKVLATAFNDGCIHFLDAEKGIVRFTVKMKTGVKRMRWQYYDPNSNVHLLDDDVFSAVLHDFSDSESLNDKSEELNQLKAMKAFSDDSIGSLLGTLMFTVDEENVVGVLAAGILPIGSIKPPMQFFVNCDPYSIRVGDIFYSTVKNQLMVVYSSVGQYCAEVNSPGINTQMIGFDLDSFDYLKSGVVWAIARRWLKLVFNMCFISETFARAIIDWEDQSKFFVEKFNSFGTEKTADHGLGECLINMILTGQANPDLVNFYRNVLKPAEWKKMANWVDKGFSDLIGSIGKDLLPGAEALQHNVRQLLTEICCTLQGSKPKNILPKRLFDVDVYPYGKYVEEESDEESLKELKNLHNLAEDVNNKMNEMHLIAVRNRKDLMNFMSWLSQTPPFTAKNKRSATDMKFDVQLVIEYIKQATMSINGNGSSQNKAMSSAQKNYSFDKVLQYFKCQKPLKCRLDVRSNLWNILPEQESTRTLTDCITSCFDALQTVQDVIQKRFTLAIVAVTNDVLELNHEEGFEKFTIFSPSQAALECRTNGEQKWRQTMASEPFAVSCIGVDGNRHIIYGALGVVFYKMHYTKQSMKSTDENAGVKQKSQGTVDSSFRLEFDNTDLCTDERQSEVGENVMGVDIAMPKSPASAKLLRVEECLNSSINRRLMHFEWVGNGNFYGLLGISKGNKEETLLFRTSLVDDTSYVHEDTSGCMETYCSCAISLRQKSGIAFTDNGARAKWFEIKIAEDHVSQVTRKKPKNINYKDEIPTNQRAQAQNTETMEVNTEAESEKDAVPEQKENGASAQLRRSLRKRKPLKK